MGQPTEAGWLLSAEPHTYVTGAELIMGTKKGVPYFPADRTRFDHPEMLVPPSPMQRRVCPVNHHPRSGDWACRVCERFNFWDHNTCAGCGKERPLQQVDRSPLRDAVVSFYQQLIPLDAGVTATDVGMLQHADAIPLVQPCMPEGAAQQPALHHQTLPQQQQQQQPLSNERHPGLGSGQPSGSGAGDQFAAFRSRKSTHYSQEMRQAKILRRNGLAQPSGFACYKCGREGHKANNCTTIL
eukprot:TRINITY_DN7698_c0_g1_i1.p2 TRINITY_DN7698_c0_g1~~TRINITY_DN7698_c0_g1_i1.p2  ORF type:complete len:241 (+),score=33.83 TRINITY_DN7698_c0_g1_i1:6774-7496(+)